MTLRGNTWRRNRSRVICVLRYQREGSRHQTHLVRKVSPTRSGFKRLSGVIFAFFLSLPAHARGISQPPQLSAAVRGVLMLRDDLSKPHENFEKQRARKVREPAPRLLLYRLLQAGCRSMKTSDEPWIITDCTFPLFCSVLPSGGGYDTMTHAGSRRVAVDKAGEKTSPFPFAVMRTYASRVWCVWFVFLFSDGSVRFRSSWWIYFLRSTTPDTQGLLMTVNGF